MAGDPKHERINIHVYCFNPRPRMAGDDMLSCRKHGSNGFNPRPRMAGDIIRADGFGFRVVSIHARVWRATMMQITKYCRNCVSIHARVWRATKTAGPSQHKAKFQSTPAYGGRRVESLVDDIRYSFNPRPRMAGDIELPR